MRRREFITLLGGSVVLSPMTARAQQAALPIVGFLSSLSAAALSVTCSTWNGAFQRAIFCAGSIRS